MKYCFILGTRPEIIKLYSCIQYCEDNNLNYFIIHTNQHYSENMDKVFFKELRLQSAKYNLGIHGGGHGEMTGRMFIELEKILIRESPDVVFVQGDTNTVLAGGLTAAKLGIQVAHIEAGLRSYDMAMPEEINRITVDHISNYLFCPTEKQKDILLKENISEEKIHIVGNTIVDAIYKAQTLSYGNGENVLKRYGLEKNDYILFTSHRPSNVDNKKNLEHVLQGVSAIQKLSEKKILFPMHPRTKKNIIKFDLEEYLQTFLVVDPVGFVENIIFESNAYMIATDSGGIQEEGCILHKKTLVLRENTERPETLEVGGAILVGNDIERIISSFNKLKNKDIEWYNPFGDGRSCEYIFAILESK